MFKTTLITFAVLTAATAAQAEKISTKFCQNMMTRAEVGMLETRLDAVVEGLNEGFSMQLTAEQSVTLKATLSNVLALNPKKINDLESTAAMPCFMDMTAQERAEAGQQLKAQAGL